MQREQKAMINTASVPPSEYFKKGQLKNLELSQYRENADELVDGPSTYLTYPVFTSLDKSTRTVKGALATSIYWKVLFSNLLPVHGSPKGIICVVQNSFNQFFSFRIDGPDATFLGFGDFHDPAFQKDYEYVADIIPYLQSITGPKTRPYTSVTFSDSVQYTLRIYPSQETQSAYITNDPVIYMVGFVVAFLLAAILFLLFSFFVERRNWIMIEKVVVNGRRAATAERELNEFLSHEVRNPLSMAITATSFITSAVMNDPKRLVEDDETRDNVCQDLVRYLL